MILFIALMGYLVYFMVVRAKLVVNSPYNQRQDAYADAIGVAGNAVLGVITGVISFNGVIEAIVAAIIVYLVGLVLNTIKPIAAK